MFVLSLLHSSRSHKGFELFSKTNFASSWAFEGLNICKIMYFLLPFWFLATTFMVPTPLNGNLLERNEDWGQTFSYERVLNLKQRRGFKSVHFHNGTALMITHHLYIFQLNPWFSRKSALFTKLWFIKWGLQLQSGWHQFRYNLWTNTIPTFQIIILFKEIKSYKP